MEVTLLIFSIYSITIYHVSGEKLQSTTFLYEIPNKSIKDQYTFMTYKSVSVLDCIRQCASLDSCYSVSYSIGGECRLCNRGWNKYCVICQDEKGAQLFSKDDEDMCLNGGRIVKGKCTCLDGFVGSECQTLIKDCKEGMSYYYYAKTTGIFYTQPSAAPEPFPVYCSLQHSRPRTYIQRHFGRKNTFNQTWNAYKDGFGDMFSTAEEFWLGNLYLQYITHSGFYTLVVEMASEGRKEIRQQDYEGFLVKEEKSYFPFTLDNAPLTPLSGLPPLGDSLSYVEGAPFSTYDKKTNLYKCAFVHGAGWWFGYPNSKDCGVCNPNGPIIQSGDHKRIGIDNEVFWENDMKDWSPWYVEMWLELRK